MGITREYFRFIFNCFAAFITFIWLVYKIYHVGFLLLFISDDGGSKLFFGLVIIVFSWIGETLSILFKLYFKNLLTVKLNV